MSKLVFTACAAMLLLAACGGHDHDDDAAMPPATTPPVATNPAPSTDPAPDAFAAQVTTLVAASPDDAEPAALDAAAPTMPENTEPVAVK